MKWTRGTSKKLLRVKVTSHESELEFDISPKSTGKYLFDLVCSTIGLRETWYFGLQNYTILSNGKMKLLSWVKLDKKLVSQRPTSQTQLCFFFHTKFFPEDIEQELIQATTRHLFYLSVKAKILSRIEASVNGIGDLCPASDVAIILASLAAQADFGDVCEDYLDGKDDQSLLPNRLLRLIPKQLMPRFQSDQNLAQKLKDCYKSYKGISRDKAELQYLKVAQAHHLFGVDYFPIICVRMKCPRTLSLARYFVRSDISPFRTWNKRFTNAWLGVTAAGIQLYGRNQREKPRYTFQWNIIKNVSYRERKFTVKLVGSWRCHNKANVGACSTLATSFDAMERTGEIPQRSRQLSRSTSGRSPLPGSATGLIPGNGGSAASAASLPTTPLSVRLTLPTVNSVALEARAVASSPSANRDFNVERSDCRRKTSPSLQRRSGRPFDIDSGCVSSLLPSSSRCSTGDTPVVASGACLTVTKFQTTDSSAAGSSASSKGSFAMQHSQFMDHMVSVVEVWLADPTQAKTVMSMCAGNHALFMRRRQPDSVEVQQMRAQAREERARREVERSRLARARAEKAEAVEARLALESRCTQLEQALLRQQALLSGNLDAAHGNESLTNEEDADDSAEAGQVGSSCEKFPPIGHKTDGLDSIREGSSYPGQNFTAGPSQTDAKSRSRTQPQSPTIEGPTCADHSTNPYHVPSSVRNRYFSSASTPATPRVRRSDKSRTVREADFNPNACFESILDVAQSLPCFDCTSTNALYSPRTSCYPPYPWIDPNVGRLHCGFFPHPEHDPVAPRPKAPGSMPHLYNPIYADEFEEAVTCIPFNPWETGSHPWNPCTRSHVMPIVQPANPPTTFNYDGRPAQQKVSIKPESNAALSTSLSAILSPIASHRLHHLRSKQAIRTPRSKQGQSRWPKRESEREFHGSVPYLPVNHSVAEVPAHVPHHLPTAVVDNRGCSLQHLPEMFPYAGILPTDICTHQYQATHDNAVRRAASMCGPGSAPGIHPTSQWPQSATEFKPTNPYILNRTMLNSPDRNYLSHCLQEERAKFALLQQQFSKQLFDTWACLRVTRSPGDAKHNGSHPITNNDLRVDPAGASDGASPCGGPGIACGLNRMISAGYPMPEPFPASENENFCGEIFRQFAPCDTRATEFSCGLIRPDSFPTEPFDNRVLNPYNPEIAINPSFNSGNVYPASAWPNT